MATLEPTAIIAPIVIVLVGGEGRGVAITKRCKITIIPLYTM